MTVQNTIVKNVYEGNGSTTVFPYTFALNKDDCIKVYITDASGTTTETTNFAIGDGSITYPASGSPLEAGSRLTIKRELPLQQVLNLVNQGPFFAEDIEDTFDELVMMIQQIDEHLKRTLSINVSIDADSEFDTTIPLSPGKTIKISDDGTHFENTEDPAVIYPLCIAQQEEATEQASIAKDRAAAALASETAAKNSENNAKGSETAANSSKLAAAQSEANASQSASVATIAAQAAASSASEASTTLDNVKSYDDTYKAYMDSSEAFANTASSAKNAAQTSASEAGASASEASGYAATAASKATEATNQASAAATKATEAAASADRAEQFADKVQDIAQLELPLSITNGGTGNSTGQAPSAISDGDGNVIKDTYLPLTGGTVSGGLNVTGTLSKGGTAVSLEGHTHTVSDVSGVLPISKGGTNASSAAEACANLGALPTSGGTMSGNLKMNSPILGSGDSGSLLLFSGGNNNFYGSTLQLFGPTHSEYAGQFYLRASTGTSSSGTNCTLSGTADGSLVWNGGTIVAPVDAIAAHRFWRGEYLGSSLTSEQATAISNGTFKNLFVGDYWRIGGVNYRIMDVDYYYNCGDTACTTHHLVIVPDTALYNAQMNSSNIVTGAYIGSKMYTTNIDSAKTTISNAFSGHLLTIRQLFSNSVSGNTADGFTWTDATVWLMNEVNVYGYYCHTNMHGTYNSGSHVWPSDKYSVDNTQYAGFAQNPRMIHARYNYWLRNVVYSASFARVDGDGCSGTAGASNSDGVRPAFCIC